MLSDLAPKLRAAVSLAHKRDLQAIANRLGQSTDGIRLGDDCAAIPDGDGYLLLAAEGLLPNFVAADPWFAGWCAVMVNISDITAMGGEAIAVVDILWTRSQSESEPIWVGMQAAAKAYQVPIVGGHTNIRSQQPGLAVAILGRAQQLITSFDAQPDDSLLMAVDLRGEWRDPFPFWNAATNVDPKVLQANLSIFKGIAKQGFCCAGKDISNAGIIGTLLMLLESSGCGAVLDLDKIPRPPGVDLEKWLSAFPSFGYLLAVSPEFEDQVTAKFCDRGIDCVAIAKLTQDRKLILRSQNDSIMFWDLEQEKIMGFG
ncbi:MAG: sll0787 family AIR synthase-like protein [Cyanobacteria bacterium P01_H01_bin.15]